MQLKFFDMECAIEIIDLKKHDVEFHGELKKWQGLNEFDKIFYFMHFPVLLKKGKKYFLIARHWVYSFYVSNEICSFPALIFQDERLLNKFLEIDRLETDEISNIAQGKKLTDKPLSRKTKTKYKAISAGRICPFCGGVLRGPRTKGQVKGGGYKITCENKSNKNIGEGKGCDFYAILTKEEFDLFKKYELPTSAWLKKINNKKCPKCNNDVFLRIGKDPETGKMLSFERCRNYKNSTAKNCTYNQRYKGEYAKVP